MTKEKIAQQPASPIQPLNPKKKYTTFYLVMLILSTAGTSLATLSLLATVPEILRTFSFAPLYSLFLAFDAVATFVALAALVLLWRKKNPLGIWLKLSAYGAVIVAYAGQLIFGSPVLQSVIEKAMQESAVDRQTAEVFGNISFYGGYIIGFIVSITMAILWWFAYKNQKTIDETQ